MNAPLRRSGVVIMVMFGLLFANLNWVQAYKADDYRTSDYNGRVQVTEYERPRGVIEAGGEALAESKATEGRLKYQRTYPQKEMYAHVIGYKPVNGAETGIERAENDFLAGTSDKLFVNRLTDMLTGDTTGGGNVALTLNHAAQQTAWKQLTGNKRGATKGAAIALDPRTGALQALVSMPSYDPNPLVSHDNKASAEAFSKLNGTAGKPLLNRALADTQPPGSTFKIITAAAALEQGRNPQSLVDAGPSYTAPTAGKPITNATSSTCPQAQVTLLAAVTKSCNTAFAKLGVGMGAEALKAKARAFGFEQTDLTVGNLADGGIPVAASRTGDIKDPNGGGDDPAALAQSSIGQNNVRMTPLQGALIAAAVANNGTQMRPYLVQQQLGPDRRPIYNATPKELNRPIDARVAKDLQDMMVNVVAEGTGKNAEIDGFRVGGKTGTAQSDGEKENHGWFIGFAFNGKGEAVSAVCVLLEEAGDGGSPEAARIAGQIMRAAAGKRTGS